MNRRELLQLGAVACASNVRAWPVLAAQTESKLGKPQSISKKTRLRLNWNENPLGAAPSARQAALEALAEAHYYPDALRGQVIAAIAEREQVESEQVILGAGSTDILRMAVHAAAEPNARLVLADPTFEAVIRYQRHLSYEVVRVPLDDRYAHDLEAMRAKVRPDRPTLIYICNPNNPTGTLTPSQEIDAWIEEAPETTLFLIDEAYHEYVQSPGYRSAVHWVDQLPNVIVTRTFSKIYALAGMRLGSALAHPETIRRLRSFLSLDNASGPTLAAGLACLGDSELLPRSRALNDKSKRIVYTCLEDLGLEFIPSHTNFLMHRIRGDLESYIRRMDEAGIRVGRPFPPMLAYNRLSLGLPEHMERFAATLRDLRHRGWV